MLMMNRFLKNKTGVTILEGLIALGLLALVAGGTFGVLLSVSRKASQPDIREEMILAVERANEQLQMYTGNSFSNAATNTQGLCGGDASPLSTGKHYISCMLPAICDQGPSSFEYTVSSPNVSQRPVGTDLIVPPASLAKPWYQTYKVDFKIVCNGFTL